MKFNICILPTSEHTQCFAEIADSIEWALKELGHEVSRGMRGAPVRGEHPIIFGLRPEDSANGRFPAESIIYNGEQVNKDGMWPSMPKIYKIYTIWDYSAANAERYAQWGLNPPKVVRPGYAPVLDRIPQSEKTHDVVFFGSSNERREKILLELERRGCSVLRVPFGVYGKKRDEYLGRAKLCINIHYYESAIFEAIRCAYLAQNGIPVISELSVDDENMLWGINAWHYEDLVDMCINMLREPGFLVDARRHQMECSKEISLLNDVRAAVERVASKGKTEKISRAVVDDVLAKERAVAEEPVTAVKPGAIRSGGEQDALVSGVMEQGRREPERLVPKDNTEQISREIDMVFAKERTEPELPGAVVQAAGASMLPKITLSMIVKNEATIIERCLASVKPYLSGWCIVDTGSTDGTQEVIRKFMADLPGQLHECSWKEFDGSRTEALDLARAECKNEGWLMLIDSDEILTIDGPLELPDGYDCYDGWFTRCEACTPWGRPLFARASQRWQYVLPRHEGLYCLDVSAPTAPEPVRNVRVLSTHDGARAQEDGYERFTRDAKALETWISRNPGHFALSRAEFYAGQSYAEAADCRHPVDRASLQKAIMHYLRRSDMGGYAQEAFIARYRAGQCMVKCGYPWERIQNTMLQAFAMRPSHAEPLYNLARYYREQGDQERAKSGAATSGHYALAVVFARAAVAIGPSSDTFPDVDHTVNDWRSKDELATALTYLNGHAEAREINRHILRFSEISPLDRQRIEANLAMCLCVAPDPG